MTEALRITQALHGHWYGRYGLACCPAHGDRRPSLSLSDGPNGRLLAHCLTGCDFLAVLDALRGLGIVEGRGAAPQACPSMTAQYQAAQRRDAEKRERQARAIWTDALPVQGTIAETYLRTARGITCVIPDSLRFAPSCWHPTAQRIPALIARVDGAGAFAVHRTYLRPDGLAKAEVDPPRAMLGPTAGGAVRLSDCAGPLVVAEGIETGLSLISGLLSAPATIWAALSTSGLTNIILPPKPSRLTIATDGDTAGQSAGQKLAERAHGLGWHVSLLPAPLGRDWNDILMLKGAVK